MVDILQGYCILTSTELNYKKCSPQAYAVFKKRRLHAATFFLLHNHC
jgi:peptidoglycan/xylan/chitin deacetylase (PgdA/CDA1 family)